MKQIEPQSRVGEIVGGKYRIVRFLASGGMGVVFEAQHLVIKRHFAIKFLHSGCTMDRARLQGFQQEAQALGSLASEHLVAPVDFGISIDGSPFLVMELLAGHPLRAIVDHPPRPPLERASDWVRQACQGVQVAHDAGIIHCDLNPRNIFLCRHEDGTDWIKVLDFGIAKHHHTDATATRAGTILGTPAYLSPEQARGDPSIGNSVDIYALGVVLFELLSGQRPHQGDSPHSLLHHISTQPALHLPALCPDLPRELVAVVEKAIHPNPEARHATAAALAQDLDPFATHVPWPPMSWETPLPQEKSPSLARITAARPKRRTRTFLVLVTLACCSAVLSVALILRALRPSSSPMIRRLPIPAGTRFFTPPPNPAAIAQIADLFKNKVPRHAALITGLVAVPQASWLTQGTPDEVHAAVAKILTHASPQNALPILVSSNRPFRDCMGYSSGGALSTASYKSWIGGLANGIGNQPAILILEPHSIGLIPFHRTLDGTEEWCKPMVFNDQGQSIPTPGATPAEVYRQLNMAIDTLKTEAPNTWVYLDGTHSNWLPVSESAYRLVQAGVLKTRGFSLNVSNFQDTWKEIYYGHWVARCIYYANHLAVPKGQAKAYQACRAQPTPSAPQEDWESVEAWYRQTIDDIAHPSPVNDLVHFVIDTSRNGRGPLDSSLYADAPFNQPASVRTKLSEGSWCNPPSAGVGIQPTIDTRHPLVDAFLWIKPVGESDGSCDIASGARAWDYSKFNPWALTGESQNRFDPLWGMVVPAAGTWFPELAIRLADNATPSLIP